MIENKSVRQIHKDLFESTINRKNKVEKAYEVAFKQTNIIKKKLPQRDVILVAQSKHPKYAKSIKNEGDAIAVLIFGLLKKADADIEKAFNEERYKIENNAKEKAIDDSIEYNRNLDTPKVFYLCSEHRDCAKDHLHLQARIYIDEKWANVVTKDKDKIESYIIEHNTMTLQEVTHRPYWLITRPHCRHYFKAIPTDQVLTKGVKKLILKYNMRRNIGDRQYVQTMDSGVGTKQRKIIGEYRNAQLMIDKYKDRLVTYEGLYKIHKTEIIKDAIVKVKFMIKKWERYLKELGG